MIITVAGHDLPWYFWTAIIGGNLFLIVWTISSFTLVSGVRKELLAMHDDEEDGK